MGEVAERAGGAWGSAPLRGITPPVTVDTHVPPAGSAIPARREGCRAYVNRVNAPRVRHRVMINLGAGNGSTGPQGCPRSRYR